MKIAPCGLALAGALSTLVLTACNNDNVHNAGVIATAPRFQLVAEKEPSATRLLFDSATGDLWELRAETAGDFHWVRTASGPADARVLTPEQALFGVSQKTSKP